MRSRRSATGGARDAPSLWRSPDRPRSCGRTRRRSPPRVASGAGRTTRGSAGRRSIPRGSCGQPPHHGALAGARRSGVARPVSRRYPDEVEVAAHRRPTQDDLGALFAPLAPAAPPRRGGVDARQGLQTSLPIGREAAYRRWRDSESGRRIYAWMESRALCAARAGAARIGVKGLFESAREHFQVSTNNTWTSRVARDLIADHPELADLIELRQESAP